MGLDFPFWREAIRPIPKENTYFFSPIFEWMVKEEFIERLGE